MALLATVAAALLFIKLIATPPTWLSVLSVQLRVLCAERPTNSKLSCAVSLTGLPPPTVLPVIVQAAEPPLTRTPRRPGDRVVVERNGAALVVKMHGVPADRSAVTGCR